MTAVKQTSQIVEKDQADRCPYRKLKMTVTGSRESADTHIRCEMFSA
jgi:hypothetical protein